MSAINKLQFELAYLKIQFFLKKRPTHFHIKGTSVIRRVKQNKLIFSSIEINKPLPSSHCLIDQNQFQKPVQVAATDQMPDHV